MMDDEKLKMFVASIRIRRMLRHAIIKGTTRKKYIFFGKSENIELHVYYTKKNTIIYIDKEDVVPFKMGDKIDVAEKWAKKKGLSFKTEPI